MKKNVIVFSIVGILLISGVLIALINKNSKNVFMHDGVLFAVKLDGESRNSFPSGNNYYVDIDCTNARGRWMKAPSTNGGNESDYRLVIDNVTGKVECNVDFQTISTSNTSDTHFLNNIVMANAIDETNNTITNSTSVTLDAGYRYEGTNPNNYIWFNNEMWRIIGVVPACTSANCATKEDLVKIIRKDQIGSIAYDAKSSDYTGVWGSNTLYTLLNTKYWGKQNATDTETCYGYKNSSKTKCDYTTIGLSSSDYYGNMVRQNVYWNTGASKLFANATTVYENETQEQTVQGTIGIMNVSDYGYGSSEPTRGNLDQYGNAEISLANWLYTNNDEWTMTRDTDTTISVSIGFNGIAYMSSYYLVYYGFAVRPVVYLKDSVYVVSGDGTESTPYQIAMAN